MIVYFFASAPNQAQAQSGIRYYLNWTTENANRVEIFGHVMDNPQQGSWAVYSDSDNWTLWAANDKVWVESSMLVQADKDTGSTLQNVSVSSRNITLSYRDPQFVDGDQMSVDINGVRVLDGYVNTGRHVSFPVSLQPGANTVTITAQNAGVTPPLVVEVTVSNVTAGPAIQLSKGLNNGESQTFTITVDPVMVQNMGVRVATVERGSLARSVRTIGEVAVAEDLVSVVNLKYSGWIDKLLVDQTGARVRRGQPLFRIYSPDLVSAQQEYLLALRTAGKDSALAHSAKTRLSLWDLSETTIARIAERNKAQRTMTITAPRSGYVLHKTVVEGARVKAGEDLFRIGKLSAIWVHAQVYEHDAPWIALGQPATMELSFQRGKLYQGRVSYIYPTLSDKTRTLTVRLEFVNPELRLKPGMFTTVRIQTRRREGVLLVPTEAILRSGERQLVFVTSKVGRYDPREIVTGLAGDGHRTEVLSGLTEGAQVVVSGQFLLDSESQLQEALQKLMADRLQSNRRVGKSRR